MIAISTDTEDRWGQLMAGAQDGDREAYTRLLIETTPFLRSAIEQRLGNVWQAERALHDTLLSVHRLRHTYDPRRPIGRWLVAIADAEARRMRVRKAARFAWPFRLGLRDRPSGATA